MELSKLNFNVELKSAHSSHTHFPNENCIGIGLNRPDDKIRRYKLRITIPDNVCKKAQITTLGYAMIKLSDCSNGMQILWQEQQGANFKGYRLRPLGASIPEKELKKQISTGDRIYRTLWAEMSIDFNLLNTSKTNKFDLKYADIIHTAKHQIVVDISDIRLYVATPENNA